MLCDMLAASILQKPWSSCSKSARINAMSKPLPSAIVVSTVSGSKLASHCPPAPRFSLKTLIRGLQLWNWSERRQSSLRNYWSNMMANHTTRISTARVKAGQLTTKTGSVVPSSPLTKLKTQWFCLCLCTIQQAMRPRRNLPRSKEPSSKYTLSINM